MRGTASYKHSLAILFSTVAVLPLLCFGVLAVGLLTKEVESQSVARNHRLAATLASGVEEILSFADSEVRTIAETVQLDAVRQDPGILHDYLHVMSGSQLLVERVRILDRSGRRHCFPPCSGIA